MSATHVFVSDSAAMHAAAYRPGTAPLGRAIRWPNRVLLGTNGSLDGEGALAAAVALARPNEAPVDVVVSYAPRVPLPALPHRTGSAQCEPCDRREVARVLRAVRGQLKQVIATRADRERWNTRIEIGDPGANLVRLAERTHPDLVIVSIHEREVLHDGAGGLTAVCAARYLDVPLLAVDREYSVPTSAVVAFPQGRLHGPTVRATLACMPAGGAIVLAFPKSAETECSRGASADELRNAVEEACGPLPSLDAIALSCTQIEGDMLSGTLNLAADSGAALIAVPNAGAAGPVRAFLPNLAEPLLFAARRSVLVVPS